MPHLSGIKAVYFDLDDTLCGYWNASKAGLRRAFGEHAPEGVTVEEMVIHWAEAYREFAPQVKTERWYEPYLASGEPTRTEQMHMALRRAGHDDRTRAEALSQAYMLYRDAELQLFDDALDILNALRGRFELGLITNGPADIQRMEIATLGIGHFFDHVFIEGEMKEGKPKPGVFARANEAARSRPEETVMVGNSFGHDIAPAIAAGWYGFWIRRDSDVPPSAHPNAKPEDRPADSVPPTATIHSLSELLPWLID
jgi:putative hydrolase of the HAD superfamily